MTNSRANRNKKSNQGMTSKYGRKNQKGFTLKLNEKILAEFTRVSKEKGISKQLILEGLLKEYLKREEIDNESKIKYSR